MMQTSLCGTRLRQWDSGSLPASCIHWPESGIPLLPRSLSESHLAVDLSALPSSTAMRQLPCPMSPLAPKPQQPTVAAAQATDEQGRRKPIRWWAHCRMDQHNMQHVKQRRANVKAADRTARTHRRQTKHSRIECQGYWPHGAHPQETDKTQPYRINHSLSA